MSLSNCKRCGNLFSRVNQPVCPKCIREEEELLEQANQWVRDNPGRTMDAMSEATGIGRGQILRWIRQKRILLAERSEAIVCKRCGDPLPSGTLCDRCKLLLSHDVDRGIKAIKESSPSEAEKEKRGMHYHRNDLYKKMRL